MPIFEWTMGFMDLTNKDHILERALKGKIKYPRTLVTALFPGEYRISRVNANHVALLQRLMDTLELCSCMAE